MAEEVQTEDGALLNWLRTFEDCPGIVMSLSELSDGVVLSCVFSEISEDEVQELQFSEEKDDSWAFHASRLRRLMARLKRWYAEVLGLRIEGDWDPEVVARKKGRGIARLVELLLGAAVRCSRRELYVKTIMESLSEEDQAILMIVVDRTLKRAVEMSAAVVVAANKEEEDVSTAFEEEEKKNAGIRRRSETDVDEEEAETLRRDLGRAHREIAELRDELTARQNVIPFSSSEANSLREEVEAASGREAEARSRLESAVSKMRDIELELESTRSERDEWHEKHELLLQRTARLESRLASVEDEADIGRAARDNLEKAEDQIHKLKKKLEEAQILKRDNKSLDDQNAKYLAEIVQLEAKAQAAADDRRQLELCRIERDQALSASASLEEDLNQANTNLEQCQEELDAALEAKRFFEDELTKSTLFSISNNKAQLSTPTTKDFSLRTEDDEYNDDNPEERSVFAADSVVLRARLTQLERDNARLSAKAKETDRLQTVADDATKRLRDSVQQTEDLRIQNRRLRDELQTRSASSLTSSSSLVAADETHSKTSSAFKKEETPPPARSDNEELHSTSSPTISRLQNALREKEAQLASATADRQKLETSTRNTLHSVQEKYSALTRSYKEKIKEKQEKISHLETRIRTDRAQHKREEALVVSAIYDLGQRIIEANLVDAHPHAAAAGTISIQQRYNSQSPPPPPPPEASSP